MQMDLSVYTTLGLLAILGGLAERGSNVVEREDPRRPRLHLGVVRLIADISYCLAGAIEVTYTPDSLNPRRS